MKRRTREVHGGRVHDAAAHVPSIDLSTTYPLPDAAAAVASIDALNRGAPPAESGIYARLHNPTVAGFEAGLAELEGAEAAIAFASGMAAITALLLAFRGHVVGVRPLYGGTDLLLSSGLLGTDVTWADPDGVGDACRSDTTLVWVETPANPTLDLVDIAGVVAQAGSVPVVVDSTFATPVLQNPLQHGARFVVHSATKFLGGHGDVVGGVVACAEADAQPIRRVRVATGGILHPLAGYLLHRGLQTLSVRVLGAQRTARELAERLDGHPAVDKVRYPALPGQDPGGLLGRQLRGPGAMLAFDVGSRERARQVLDALQLATSAVSLGSVDTLVQHPASLTHRNVDPAVADASGITAGLLRVSVGLEDADDLWTDLLRGLDRLPA